MAARRTPDQIKADRSLIAKWHYQRYTDEEITDLLFRQTGVLLSRRQINFEVGQIRRAWLKKQEISYDARMAEELERLDVLEAEIWRAMRESAGERSKKAIEEVARKIARNETDSREEEEQFQMFTNRILTTVEMKDINPAYFDKILAVQQERRKLLGLYPSPTATQNLQINVIKGYHASVSPDLWPDPVDGEYIEEKPAQLTAGLPAD